MVQSLKKKCFLNICLNLNLNYQLCKTYGLKIPKKIGEEMLKYLFKIKAEINVDDAKIFEKDIMDLSHFYSTFHVPIVFFSDLMLKFQNYNCKFFVNRNVEISIYPFIT